jgi:hypothetical protein
MNHIGSIQKPSSVLSRISGEDGMFGKRSTIDEFGASLKQMFLELVEHQTNSFLSQIELPETIAAQLEWPAAVRQEVGALLYFAFDFGIASGKETLLRNGIRDAFLAVSPPPPSVGTLLSSRTEEYKAAMMEPDHIRQQLELGNVFAKHLGHDKDPFLATKAALSFKNAYSIVTGIVDKNMKRLR